MNCSHQNTRLVLTPELMHYGKIVCADCGKFLNWAKHPETIARDAKVAVELDRLRVDGRLTAWEREFIAKLDPKMSPKQRGCFDAIAAKYV